MFVLLAPAGIYAVFRDRHKKGLTVVILAIVNLCATAALTGNSPSPIIRFVNSGFFLLTDLLFLCVCAMGLLFLLKSAGRKWLPACAVIPAVLADFGRFCQREK
ncbi:MAG: hypothetical protein LLG37_11160 [Spirochaetia bacterium]|nr:hypothetical protein [Spirochaetia bacterium]